MRTKQPYGLQAGLMWFDPDRQDALQNIRHQAQERDGEAPAKLLTMLHSPLAFVLPIAYKSWYITPAECPASISTPLKKILCISLSAAAGASALKTLLLWSRRTLEDEVL